MGETVNTRRGFLGRVLGASAAATLTMFGGRQAEAQQSDPDGWINSVKGRHRALFDFPQHKNGVPMLHILNYLNTYRDAYKSPAGEVAAVGTFYSVGTQARDRFTVFQKYNRSGGNA